MKRESQQRYQDPDIPSESERVAAKWQLEFVCENQSITKERSPAKLTSNALSALKTLHVL